MKNANSEPKSGTKKWIKLEARRIDLAGKIAAVHASGIGVVKAGLDEAGHAFLEVDEDAVFAGFNHLVAAPDGLPRFLAACVRSADPVMMRLMLIGQLRAIWAGNSAMIHGDIFDAFGLHQSEWGLSNYTSGFRVFHAFARLVGMITPESERYPMGFWEALRKGIWSDARELVTSNWHDVYRIYRRLKDEPSKLSEIQANLSAPGLWPVNPEKAKLLFDTAEESALGLAQNALMKRSPICRQ